MTEDLSPATLAATHQAAFTQTRPWSAAEFESLLSSPLVFATGDARCFALVRVVADEAELLTIATHPNLRRQGLARALMLDWHRIAHSRGATRAFLEVAADNHPAQALYDACGYAEIGKRDAYYTGADGSRIDAVLLECGL